MSSQHKSRNTTSEIRRVRAEIARQRRRMDRRVDNLMDHTLLVGAAREFVRDHPARSVLSATGAGMLLGELLGMNRNAKRLGESLVQLAVEQAWPRLFGELRQLRRDWHQRSRQGGHEGDRP